MDKLVELIDHLRLIDQSANVIKDGDWFIVMRGPDRIGAFRGKPDDLKDFYAERLING